MQSPDVALRSRAELERLQGERLARMLAEVLPRNRFWAAKLRTAVHGLAAGGLSSGARLRMLLDHQATVVFCTPTYALHLAEVAREQGIRLEPETPGYAVKCLIVAGEPGGSIPATKQRIEAAWHARV